MAVFFTEERGLPREFTRGGGYEGFGRARLGDTYQDGFAKIMDSISPFKLLEGIFVTKPATERAAQVELARLQAQAQGQSAFIKSQNMEELLKYGAIGVGALVLVIILTKRKPAPAKVAGYRRSKRRRSRR